MQKTQKMQVWSSIPWSRKWHPTPVFLRAEFHGQQSLVGNSPWSSRESDMAQQLNTTQQQYYCRLWLTSFPWGQALYKKAKSLSGVSVQQAASPCTHQTVSPILEAAVCLCVLTSKGSKTCWFFSLFSFLLSGKSGNFKCLTCKTLHYLLIC